MSGLNAIEIKAFPRIHVTLIGRSRQGLRINGGIGFSIEQPGIKLTVTASEVFRIMDNRSVSIDDSQRLRLDQKINEVKAALNFSTNIKVTIDGDLPTHSGFGSGTIIRLACLEGLFILNSHMYSEQDLVATSGRGGTSGVGIRTYFNGGYIFDVGHKNVGQELLPSSSREIDTKQALSISEGQMPSWDLGVCYPKTALPMKESEKTFFENNSNLKNETINETLYNVVFGVLAGIKENDRELFERGVRGIQQGDWKLAEVELYFNELRSAIDSLYQNGAMMVGITSVGPGLFFTANNLSKVIANTKQILPDWHFFETKTNNHARLLSIRNA